MSVSVAVLADILRKSRHVDPSLGLIHTPVAALVHAPSLLLRLLLLLLTVEWGNFGD